MLSARLRLLPYLGRALPHNATVSFHTGAAEAMAKVRLLEQDKLEPGASTWVQLMLDKPIAVVRGDHFIIRSPMETLGGGKVVDLNTRRLRRNRPAIIQGLKVKEEGTAEEVLITLLEAKQPLELSALLVQSALPSGDVRADIESLARQGKVIRVGQGESSLMLTAPGWERLTKQATTILEDYHRKFPTRSGVPGVELGSRLKLGKHAPAVWQRLSEDGVLIEEGLAVRLSSHQVQLTPAQQAKIDAFLKSLAQNPYAPPGDQVPEPDLLNLLVEQRKVVKMSDNVVFSTTVYNEMVEKVTAYTKAHGKVTLAEVRDLFNTTRKYAQAFLEHLDEEKITRRRGDERVLY